MDKTKNPAKFPWWFPVILIFGILLRLLAAARGHNDDLDALQGRFWRGVKGAM